MQVQISFEGMNQSISEMGRIISSMANLKSEIDILKTHLSFDYGFEFSQRIEKVSASTEAAYSDLIKIQNFAKASLKEYQACENKLSGTSKSQNSSIKWSSLISKENKKTLLKTIGNFGTAGSIASSTFGIIDDPSSIGKNLPKLVGTGAKTAAKMVDGKTIDLFGFSSTVDAIGFRENLATKLDGYVINNSYNSLNSSVAAKNAANISAVANWAGVAVAGLVNFADNVEEYNADFSNPRVYAETVTETAIDVGLGILVGAGVAALAGATAPVWAVGVVSTGVVLGLDALSKKITGKKFTESVSDWYLDTVESKIVTQVAIAKDTAKAVGKAISTTVDHISAGWKKITGWF